jgi:uncharacterized protein (TIGR02246 family)
MNRRIAALSVIAVVGMSLVVRGQAVDPAVLKIADDYQVVFNKADAKAVAALYTADALRIGPGGQLQTGRPAIEKEYAGGFAGTLKGSKLTLHQGAAKALTADIALIEGTYEVTGGGSPGKGRYLNTVKREAGRWLLASVVTVPDTAK